MAKAVLLVTFFSLIFRFSFGMFTESWPLGINFDLDRLRLKLTPTSTASNANSGYTACITNAASSPSDFGGSWTITPYGDDETKRVNFGSSKQFKYYGANYGYIQISSNGNFQFSTTPDTDYNGTITSHFANRRVSAVFTDLDPSVSGAVIRHKQLTDGFVVQFLNVPSYDSNMPNDFEARFSWNGTIDLSWFSVAPVRQTVVGLSKNSGSSESRATLNLSGLTVCPGVTLLPRPDASIPPFNCTRASPTPAGNLTKAFLPLKVRGLYPELANMSELVRANLITDAQAKSAAAEQAKLGSTRIVGGSPVTNASAYPFMVAMLDKDGFQVCGGSLISRRYVLTAAHCADYCFQVLLNSLSTYPYNATAQVRAVVNRYVHPQYDLTGNTENDIAVMEIESYVSDNFVFIRTNMSRYEAPGTMMRVIGWGHSAGVIGPDGSGTQLETQLQEVDLPLVSWDECTYPDSCNSCEVGYPASWVENDSMVCAGYVAGGKDTCFGDSGGPMFTATPPYVQVGIVSWGVGCALPNYFGVFTRVSKFTGPGGWLRQFIDDTVFACNAYLPSEDGQQSPPPPPPPPPPFVPTASDLALQDAYAQMQALATQAAGPGGTASFSAAENAMYNLYVRMQAAQDDAAGTSPPSSDQLLLNLYRRMQVL